MFIAVYTCVIKDIFVHPQSRVGIAAVKEAAFPELALTLCSFNILWGSSFTLLCFGD